ncbi:MAG TPA: 6-carboxytetrahydropterin synthase [Longimicrobiales bacterium]|nr:6-carboxytetrahydropterin synthase [Longimicrobiales bacterium]
MGIAYLTRRVVFAAAHRYYRDDWSGERNAAAFGACANAHGHGHNYALEATVAGSVDAETGFSVDLGLLDRVLMETVVDPLDHRHINHAVPEFGPGGLVPTTENLVAWAWPRIAERLPSGVTLHRLRLREDDTLFVDYYGGGPGPMP